MPSHLTERVHARMEKTGESYQQALRHGERLLDDPYASFFVDAGAHAAESTQRFLELPFFREGVRLRTRYIDDAVRDCKASGNLAP